MNPEALTLAREARHMEREIALWHVRQHPLNVYPEGHAHHRAPYPRPFTYEQADALRQRSVELFRLDWDALVPAPFEVAVGTHGLWSLFFTHYIPVRVADTRFGCCGGYVERLDDHEPLKGRRRAWYRIMEWREIRVEGRTE